MDYKTIRTHINYKTLSKLFFDLAQERYPTPEKIKQHVTKLVEFISRDPIEKVHLKISVLSMMRNMVKEVSPSQLYRSIQHRDELYSGIIGALEDFEDVLEELTEQLEEE